MKRILLIPLVLLTMLSARAQQHVQAMVDEMLRHSGWVTYTNRAERSDPKTGALLKRNIEYRLSLPADCDVIDRMTAAFEADRGQAYTYVRTSTEYNQMVSIRRPVEMRLQNDVRLEAGSMQYSYLLLNVLNTSDPRFRTTTIFLWRPEHEGRIEARVYVLYGIVPLSSTQPMGGEVKGAPAIEQVLTNITTPTRREIMERDPATGVLTTYTRSMSVNGSEAEQLVKAFKRDMPHAYTSTVNIRAGGDTIYRVTVADDTLRMAYVLTISDKVKDVQAVFGPLAYSERRSDIDASPTEAYTIANKGCGMFLGIDYKTRHAVTTSQALPVTLTPMGRYYCIGSGQLALTDARTVKNDGGYILTWETRVENDPRQQWIIVRHGEHYNLVNVATKQTANLANGKREAGAMIISYITNNRNAMSNNRLWQITNQ